MMHTFSGVNFDFNAMDQSMVRIQDIAHHLSLICRYNGGTRFHYSVAQHSIYVARAVAATNPELELPALVHDAPETYTGDMTHDLKHSPELNGFRLIDHRVERVVARALGIEALQMHDPIIKLADRRMAVTEKRDLFDYEIKWEHKEYQVPPYPSQIEEWSPRYAETRFLQYYYDLKARMG